MNKLFVAGAAVAALAVFPASAQPPAGGPGPRAEGPVTRAQMQQRLQQRFAQIIGAFDRGSIRQFAGRIDHRAGEAVTISPHAGSIEVLESET